MVANLLVIKERKRPDPFLPAAPSDFGFEVGESIDPQIVVTNPRITLYCLDHANQQALFVENAPGTDLSQAPFFYQAQYENTVNLYGVSYDTLHELAKGIALDSHNLIFVYSTGRSGSTLVGAALNAVDGKIADMGAVYKALGRDSQADSPIAQEILAGRDFELSDQHRADLAQALATHPTIQDGHFVVPSTWERQ